MFVKLTVLPAMKQYYINMALVEMMEREDNETSLYYADDSIRRVVETEEYILGKLEGWAIED